MESYLILRDIVEERGKSILKDRKILASLLADLLPHKDSRERVIEIAAREGIGDFFADICSQDEVTQKATLNKVYEIVVEEIGLTRERAAYIINGFLYAVGLEGNNIDRDAGKAYVKIAKECEEKGDTKLAELMYRLLSDNCDERAKLMAGKTLLKAGSIDARIKGFEILKSLGSDESFYYIAMEYMEGVVVCRSFSTAFKYLIKGIGFQECELELGKLFYLGLGVKADIRKAIRCFEHYLEVADSGELKAVPFLIECYYEDLIVTGSERSLKKLSEYADVYGFRMAARYLLRYYADTDSANYNAFLANRYMKRLKKKKKNPLIISSKAWGSVEMMNLDIRVSNGLYLYLKGEYEDSILSMKNHLLLGENVTEYDCEDSGSLAFYLMGMMYFMENSPCRNLLRSEVFLKNYLEDINAETSPDNYASALETYSRLLLNHKPKSKKWMHADYIAELSRELSGRTSSERLMKDMLAKVKYYGEKGDIQNAVGCLEKAVDYGFRDDFSIIGIVYLNGENNLMPNEDKAFFWLNKFYEDYYLNRLNKNMQREIAEVEYYLAKCYELGIGTKANHEKAHALINDSAVHGHVEAQHWQNITKVTKKLFEVS